MKLVAPVDGFTVTTLFAPVVPQSPTEVAVIVAVPLKTGLQLINQVTAFIVPEEAGNTEYVIETLFADVAV